MGINFCDLPQPRSKYVWRKFRCLCTGCIARVWIGEIFFQTIVRGLRADLNLENLHIGLKRNICKSMWTENHFTNDHKTVGVVLCLIKSASEKFRFWKSKMAELHSMYYGISFHLVKQSTCTRLRRCINRMQASAIDRLPIPMNAI